MPIIKSAGVLHFVSELSRLGRIPRLVAADASFYSAKNEVAAKAKGVKRVCIPNRSTKSPERRREQKKRWFRQGQKWRTGCEGRISVVKRRHGLNRCRYKGDAGMKRWVGLGVIADSLINMANPGRDAAADVMHGQCLPAAGKFARLRRCERSVSSRLGSLCSSRFLMINGIDDALILAARLLLATLFLIFGWRKLRDLSGTVSQMVQLGLPTPVLAAVLSIIMELPVAFAVAVGAFTRPSAALMALYALGTALIGHRYWTVKGADLSTAWTAFTKTSALWEASCCCTLPVPENFSPRHDLLAIGPRMQPSCRLCPVPDM